MRLLDAILELYVEKHLSGAAIIKDHGFDENLVRWIQRRVNLNEWKRFQAAPGLRVSIQGLRYGATSLPLAQRFSD